MATDITQPGCGRGAAEEQAFSASGPASQFTRRIPPRASPRAEGADSLERGLGWFSVALGAAALAAPRTLCRMTGVRSAALMRLVGARELSAGLGILRARARTRWLWSRVAGDAMDLALLSFARRDRRGRATVAFAAAAGVTALDVLAAARLTRASTLGWMVPGVCGSSDVYLERSITIGKSPEECYRFWRSFENLPRFMESLESVERLDERLSRWVAKGPAATRLEWTSEMTIDRPGEEIAWRSVNDSGAAHSGVVRFERAPAGRGTIVRVSLHYSARGGALGAALVKLLEPEPQGRIREDLRRFKQMMEAGEIPTTRGQRSGRRSLLGRVIRQWGLRS